MVGDSPLARMRGFLALVAFVVSLALIGVAFQQGKKEGLDARINYGMAHDIWAMTIAISRGFYHSAGGYIGHAEVRDALIKELTPAGIYNVDKQSQLFAQNRHVIERAIQAAISLDPKTFRSYKELPFVVNWGEDSGQADYYRLAFFIFGYHADSMYKLYFLLLTLSACVFAWHYRKQPWAMAGLLALCSGFCTLFFIDTFYHMGMPSVNSNRFMVGLTLIAILHWLLLFSDLRHKRERLSRSVLWPATLQALLIAFVISVRHSAQLMLTLAMLWALLPPAIALLKAKWRRRPLWPAVSPARHVLAALALLIFVTGGYASVRLMMHNSVYFTSCVQPMHFTWHSMYIGLAGHPLWQKLAPEGARGQADDGISFMRSKKVYEEENPGKQFVCNLMSSSAYPARAHEKIMFREYMSFALKHPRYMLELHGWYKPRALYYELLTRLADLHVSWRHELFAWWVVAFGAGLFLPNGWLRGARPVAVALFAMFAMSLVPPIVAYARYMSDIVWLLLSFSLLPGSVVAAWLGAQIKKWVPGFSQDA